MTVTAQVSVLVPSATLVAVIVAVPTARPVTSPVSLTLAMAGAELVQVTCWLAPPWGDHDFEVSGIAYFQAQGGRSDIHGSHNDRRRQAGDGRRHASS